MHQSLPLYLLKIGTYTLEYPLSCNLTDSLTHAHSLGQCIITIFMWLLP